MGVGSAKKAAAKDGRSPAESRRSVAKSMKAGETPSPSTTQGSSKRPRHTPRKQQQTFSHQLPTDQQRQSNGRVRGRNLIVWGRPRMAEKLLLHIQYECARHKITLPWDAIAHRLHPGSSGGAMVQHLNRMRRELISEGHLVPPIPIRPGSGETIDVEIRGYIREDTTGGGDSTVRPVKFDETCEDRKFSLPSFYDVVDEGDDDQDSDHVFGGNYDETEAEDSLPESPTPLGRAYRKLASTRTRVPQRSSETPGLESPLENPFGGDDHQPADKEEGVFSQEHIMSPAEDQTPHGAKRQPHDIAEELSSHYPQMDSIGLPRMINMRPPMSAFPFYNPYSMTENFDGCVAPTAVESSVPPMKSPPEYNYCSTYPFLPWQMGYGMPYAHTAFQPTLGTVPRNPPHDSFLPFGPTSPDIMKKEVIVQAGSTSESETPSGSTQFQDLIVSAPWKHQSQFSAHTTIQVESALDDSSQDMKESE